MDKLLQNVIIDVFSPARTSRHSCSGLNVCELVSCSVFPWEGGRVVGERPSHLLAEATTNENQKKEHR